jgi:hypothetical protein
MFRQNITGQSGFSNKHNKKNRIVVCGLFSVAAFILSFFIVFTLSGSHIKAAACTYTPDPTLGSVNKNLSASTAGTYRIWSRIQVPDTTNNSYYLQVDGSCAINVGDSSSIPANTWTWVNYQDGNSANLSSVDLTQGTHQVLLSVREKGVKVDRVVLAADTTCVPTGNGDNCANPDSTPPAVNVTAPTSGATVSGSGVVLTANASDNVGVAGVQFKVDGNNVGSEVTSSPYSVTWNSIATTNGSHVITAVARDSANNSTTSSPVTVTVSNVVDTTPPTISITAPSGGATVTGSNVVATANASDNVGIAGVQFKLDGTNLQSEDTSSPYSITWDTLAVANGSHTITAVARDGAGNTTTSSSVSVTVSNTAANITMGFTGIGTIDDSGNAGQILAQQATLSQNATIQSMSFYVGTAAGNVRLAVYDNSGSGGGPGAKVAETAEIAPTITGWATANTTTHPVLTAGTYWLAYSPSSSSLHFRADSGGTFRSAGFTYNVLPATFPAATNQTGQWSLYASLTSGGTSAKPGDINGDNTVNITDLSMLLSSYGQSTTQCITNSQYKCDLSIPGDGVVNIFDLSILLSNYGT